MNERIKQLALQAKLMAEEDINRQISYNTELKAFAEKFAELIVRECVIRAEREWLRNGSDTEHNKAITGVIKSIKEHFGVEE